jgi:hypothetical protein
MSVLAVGHACGVRPPLLSVLCVQCYGGRLHAARVAPQVTLWPALWSPRPTGWPGQKAREMPYRDQGLPQARRAIRSATIPGVPASR